MDPGYLAPMRHTDQDRPIEDLVIVGSGFVGTALAERLREKGLVERLRVTTRSDERRAALADRGLDAHAVDLADRDALRSVVDGATHVVFSAAAGRGGDYGAVYDRGSAHLVDALGGAHLVYTSSTGVYAASDGSWVDEDSPRVPREGRGGALRAGEDHVLAAGGAVLRLSGLIGATRGPHRRVGALAGTERDDGDAWLNLAPLPTVLDALETALLRLHRGVVNVSAAAPLRRRDFYDRVLARAGAEPIRWSETPADAPRGRRVRVDRLRTVLDVEPLPLDLDLLLG